jgi:hypothetical protein
MNGTSLWSPITIVAAECDHIVSAAVFSYNHSSAQTVRPIYIILSGFDAECSNLDCSAIEIFIHRSRGGRKSPKPPKFDQIFDSRFRTSSRFSPTFQEIRNLTKSRYLQ